MKILIATDGSEYSKAAIAKSCEFIIPDKTSIEVVSVSEPLQPIALEPYVGVGNYYNTIQEDLTAFATNSVTIAETEIRNRFPGKVLDITTKVITGSPDQAIVEEATAWGADLIVVGSHGRGFWGRLLGSVSDGVVHHAPCSVLVVRKPE